MLETLCAALKLHKLTIKLWALDFSEVIVDEVEGRINYYLIEIKSKSSNCFSKIPTENSFKKRFQLFLVWELASNLEKLSRLNCQFDIFSCVRTLIRFRAFLIQETVNVLLLVFSGINFVYSFVSKFYFKTSEKRGNIGLLSTTPSHCTPMADSVQWLSKSDYSICISVLVGFYY